MTHTEENNVAVSRDSNGYVVVRTLGGGGSALYRADGSMVRGNDRDLMIGFNDLQEVGVPMISTVTPANAGDAWASHKSIVDEALATLQQGGTPVEVSAAAAKVERIADAWRSSGVKGEDGTLMADQLEALAKTLSGAADGRKYRGTEAGTVTQANSAVAWAAHQPVITQSLAILNEGGTPARNWTPPPPRLPASPPPGAAAGLWPTMVGLWPTILMDWRKVCLNRLKSPRQITTSGRSLKRYSGK